MLSERGCELTNAWNTDKAGRSTCVLRNGLELRAGQNCLQGTHMDQGHCRQGPGTMHTVDQLEGNKLVQHSNNAG